MPTWRFFDRVGARPRLFVRSTEADEWRPVGASVTRNWRSVFFAPENGAMHADRNLLDRLIDEIDAGVDLETSVTYRWLVRLAAVAVATDSFRLKVVATGEDVVLAEASRP